MRVPMLLTRLSCNERDRTLGNRANISRVRSRELYRLFSRLSETTECRLGSPGKSPNGLKDLRLIDDYERIFNDGKRIRFAGEIICHILYSLLSYGFYISPA